jgi:hypothetical protein
MVYGRKKVLVTPKKMVKGSWKRGASSVLLQGNGKAKNGSRD